MNYVSGFFLSIAVFLHAGCRETGHPLTYQGYSTPVRTHVNEICRNVLVTHFVVKNREVYFQKSGDGSAVPLRNFRSPLPDGYYYCEDRPPRKVDLE